MINHSTLGISNKIVIILGDKETGKTSILEKYTKQRFSDNYKSTIGADFYSKEVTVIEQSTLASNSVNFSVSRSTLLNNLTMNMWDTSGSENDLKIIDKNLYKNANAFIICCSYDSLESLANVKNWLSHINSIIPPENKKDLPILILCNKFDLNVKKFGNKEIQSTLQNFLKDSYFNIKLYHQVSAKTNKNVDYVFEKLIYYMTNKELKVSKGSPNDNQSEPTRRQTLSTEKKPNNFNNVSNSRIDITFDIDANKLKSFVLSGHSMQSKQSKRSFNMDKCRSSCCK
jgi:Ras-related protein Rab-7A